MSASSLARSRLGEIVRGGPRRAEQPHARCDLCAAAIGVEHRHLLDLISNRISCSCAACAILFDRREAGGGHYRLLPERVQRLPNDVIDDATWSALAVPVDMAFFYRSSARGRPQAFYPGPMGATESSLELAVWDAIEGAHASLRQMEPDVEALLVDRTRGKSTCWLVPLHECYRLVALIRSHWKGLSGGERVWSEIDNYFTSLERKARGLAPNDAYLEDPCTTT